MFCGRDRGALAVRRNIMLVELDRITQGDAQRPRQFAASTCSCSPWRIGSRLMSVRTKINNLDRQHSTISSIAILLRGGGRDNAVNVDPSMSFRTKLGSIIDMIMR